MKKTMTTIAGKDRSADTMFEAAAAALADAALMCLVDPATWSDGMDTLTVDGQFADMEYTSDSSWTRAEVDITPALIDRATVIYDALT